MKKILVTGGPVHAHLDSVKIITNRFRGGLMCKLTEDLLKFEDVEVTYLCAPKAGAQIPKLHPKLSVVKHEGFDDYLEKVVQIAPTVDAVVLGAAVANLIPLKPWKGKFPSHNYKPGEEILIPFQVAPRIIDEVKKVAPKVHLFGYKLLTNVTKDELIRAAYEIVLAAKATAVIANDTNDLSQKFAVTKERGVHPLDLETLPSWIYTMIHDKYYSTKFVPGPEIDPETIAEVNSLIKKYKGEFISVETGLIFGTVAIRRGKGFVTTGRGKKELESLAFVENVDHSKREVLVRNNAKASLNSPLLHHVFQNRNVERIVHYHKQFPGLPTYDYAPPGSVRDSIRDNHTSFNIREHGCMLLFNQEGKLI